MKIILILLLIIALTMTAFGQKSNEIARKRVVKPAGHVEDKSQSVLDVIAAADKEFNAGKKILKTQGFEKANIHFVSALNLISASNLSLEGKLNDLYLEITAFMAKSEPQEVTPFELPKTKQEIAKENLEASLLGARPKQNPNGSVPIVLSWLNESLNDPYSMKIVRWSKVQKRLLLDEPCWYVTVRLRAKNGFGAYILNEYAFYIRRNKILHFYSF